jgi:adenylate cyclase
LQLALQDLARVGIGPTPDPVHEEWLRLGETSIPFLESGDGGYSDVDDQGYQVMLDFHQSDGGFESVPLHTALLGELAPGSLTGRIVLVGASAESLHDFALVPDGIGHGDLMERGAPGVWVHASFLDQILRFAHGEARPLGFVSDLAENLGIAAVALLGGLLAAAVGRISRFATMALATGTLAGLALLGFVAYASLTMGTWIPIVAPGLAWIGTAVAQTAWMSGRERAQRAELMRIFSQVQSPRVADELWRRRDEYLVDGRLAPEAATVTVLFLDMKGYTASAEKMPPDQLMSWINEFMAPMARLIEEHGGYPDDYFGDGIKADFGVPVLSETEEEIAETARDAIRCSLAMVEELGRINEGYSRAGLPTVALRIGIHTGPVVVGLLGSRNKGKYTVVGEAVVTAQRLESTDKVEHDFEREPCRILLSEKTYSLLGGSFLGEQESKGHFESVGEIALKGKAAQVGVYAMRTARN